MSSSCNTDFIQEQIKFIEGVDEITKDILVQYTISSGFINAPLWKNKKILPSVIKQIKKLDNAFDNVPPLEEPIVVWRGVNTKNATEGSHRNFLSTSLSRSISEKFTDKPCCLMKISLPAGTKVLPVFNLSRHENECELILPRGGTIVVLNTHQEDNLEVADCTFLKNGSITVDDLQQVSTAVKVIEKEKPKPWFIEF